MCTNLMEWLDDCRFRCSRVLGCWSEFDDIEDWMKTPEREREFELVGIGFCLANNLKRSEVTVVEFLQGVYYLDV